MRVVWLVQLPVVRPHNTLDEKGYCVVSRVLNYSVLNIDPANDNFLACLVT